MRIILVYLSLDLRQRQVLFVEAAGHHHLFLAGSTMLTVVRCKTIKQANVMIH
jgi:hypothetical protein